MSLLSALRMNGIVLALVTLTMLLPAGTAFFCGETEVIPAFLIPAVICFILGFSLFMAGRKKKFFLSPRASFVSVAFCWITASLAGALPFVISGYIPSFTDAFFESASGFTTTGATILSDVESLPRSINLWRCQMHWLGGMGIVALTVALLPFFGVGGFQLIKAETTGPEKGKITPKITMTAKILWFIYFGFTVLETIALMIAGMDFIEALSHSFATLGTGGFGLKNASIGGYDSPSIQWIIAVFMLLSGINFSLYYHLFHGKIRELTSNTELKVYLLIVAACTAVIAFSILPIYQTFGKSIRHAFFQVSAIITTTGFSTADFAKWPPLAQMVLFFLMFIGGCSGSTGGGVKVIRWVILSKQMNNEVKRLLHPHGVFTIRLNNQAGRKDVVFSVAGFMYLYFLLVLITAIVACLNGIDIFSAFTASLSMVGNIGPGFGAVGPSENFGFFNAATKWWFSFAMIAGRLELYTMLVFFTPAFWKR